jgi:hypothetical protein
MNTYLPIAETGVDLLSDYSPLMVFPAILALCITGDYEKTVSLDCVAIEVTSTKIKRNNTA